jgi:hypothetical protein
MKTPETFALRAKQFIDGCCRQRLLLLRTGRSQITDDGIYDIATGLRTELQTLVTDKQLALFIRRRAADIMALMPGRNCKGIKTRIQKLNELTYAAGNILNENSYKLSNS